MRSKLFYVGIIALMAIIFIGYSCKVVNSDDISTSSLRTWTAPEDTGGFVVEYDLRYTDDTTKEWNDWFQIYNEPIPGSPGSPESLTVSIPNGTWFFGIKSRDDSYNWSAISNIIKVKIDTIPPMAIVDLN